MKEGTAAFHIARSASMPLNSFILAPRPETLAFFRTTSIFWSSGPRRGMNLVEWTSSGGGPRRGIARKRRQMPRAAKTAEGDSVRDDVRDDERDSVRDSERDGVRDGVRNSVRDSSRRQGLDRLPLRRPLLPNVIPASASTIRNIRVEHGNQSQTDADAQTDGLYSLKRSTTARSVFAALMMASLPKTQTAPSRAMASRPAA